MVRQSEGVCEWTRRNPRANPAVAADYDTVYVSLWKMFGLPFGAVLAGPAGLLEGVEHDRRRLGGALPQFWPIAAVVLDELPRLEPDWMRVFAWLSELKGALAAAGSLPVLPTDTAVTNTFWLQPPGDAVAYKARCRARGIVLGDVPGERIFLRGNPMVIRIPAAEIARILVEEAA